MRHFQEVFDVRWPWLWPFALKLVHRLLLSCVQCWFLCTFSLSS